MLKEKRGCIKMIACDVDGTICGRNFASFKLHANQKFSLGISQERLATYTTYTEFVTCPEMFLIKERIGEPEFSRKLGWLDFDTEALLSDIPYRGSIEGLRQLIVYSPIRYYTARYAKSVKRREAMAQATYQWLAQHNYPSAQAVVFCLNIADKLLQMCEYIQEHREPIILIDDSYEKILRLASELSIEEQALLQEFFTLVCFRTHEIPEAQQMFRCLAMPSWNQRYVNILCNEIQRKEVTIP
jgi:uncharacterized HAD superfamily protein